MALTLRDFLHTVVEHSNILLFSWWVSLSVCVEHSNILTISPGCEGRTLVSLVHSVHGVALRVLSAIMGERTLEAVYSREILDLKRLRERKSVLGTLADPITEPRRPNRGNDLRIDLELREVPP